MTLPKELGRLGIKDFEMVTIAVNVRRLRKFWNDGGSILARWVRRIYTFKEGTWPDKLIPTQDKDSIMWRAILMSRDEVNDVMLCSVSKNSYLYGLWKARGVEGDERFCKQPRVQCST